MASLHSSPFTACRLLITGGCGFIGLNLIKFLINKGYQNLRILDNLSIGTKENLESLLLELGPFTKKGSKDILDYSLTLNSINSIQLFVGDIRNKETCLNATKGIDGIIHLAAHAGVIPSIQDPFFDFETNVLGTLNLLHAAVNNKVDRFIFASSNAPLGDYDPPLNESKMAKPLSPYGASKLSCEGYCSAFHASYGLKTVVLRFSNVYGPYSLHKNSVIAKFIKDGILKGQLTVYGDGTQTRDFIHEADLCYAVGICLAALEKEQLSNQQIKNKGKIAGEIFHLGTGEETAILELAELIQGLFGKKITLSFSPERKGEIKRNYSEISKAKDALGFEPKIGLEAGIKGVYEWFMKQGVKDLRETTLLSGSE
jgi:UDP-glucose 4-epimerase